MRARSCIRPPLGHRTSTMASPGEPNPAWQRTRWRHPLRGGGATRPRALATGRGSQPAGRAMVAGGTWVPR